MSIAVIGGVVTSTLLTLVVVPIFYTWFDRITFRGWKEWREDRRARKEAKRLAQLTASGLAGGAVAREGGV